MNFMRTLACAGLLLIMSALPSAAGEMLSGGELRNLFPGRFHAVVSGVIKLRIVAGGDGSLSAINAKGKKDQGRWSVQSDKLCIKFDKWLRGRRSCTPVAQEAGWYKGSLVKFKRI